MVVEESVMMEEVEEVVEGIYYNFVNSLIIYNHN